MSEPPKIPAMPFTNSKLAESLTEFEHGHRLFQKHEQSVYRRTDHLFAGLMTMQWLAAIAITIWISPKAWAGASSQIHPHIWVALFIGGVFSILPVILALTRPGAPSTRYVIAVGQMLMGAFLIHLTGGRIETHFHVFGSLAFLAFYRDWRVLIPASLVVVADHYLRGVFWPQSVYGVLSANGWRTLEHAAWIVFEDFFLVISCLQIKRDMWNQAQQTARRNVSEQRYRQLADVIQGTGVTSNLDELLRLIHRAIGKVLYAENFFVALYDKQTAMITMQFFVDQFDDAPPAHKLGKSRSAYVFRTGRPALITNDVLDQLVEQGEVESIGTPPASWLGIPLETPSAIIGVLVVQHYSDPEAYSERDIEFMTSVASQIALAIERKQAEESLRESEERYRDLFENANDIIYTHDLQGNYTSVNKACEKITGYTADESVGMNAIQVIAPDYVETAMKMLSQRVNRKGPSAYELEIVAKNGSRVALEINSRLTYQNGKPFAVQGIARDITERKRAEAERQVISEIVTGIVTTANLRELLNLIHQSISKILYAENCYVALYENTTGLLHLPLCVDKYDPVAPSMKLGNGLTAYVIRSGYSMLLPEKAIHELVAQGEVELIGTLPAVWLGVPLRTPAETVGVLVVQHYEDAHAYSTRDLEFLSSVGDQIALAIESKRMEECLRESEEKYRTILESIEDGYFEVSLNGSYSFLNDGFCRITERSEDELLGHSYKEFFAPDLTRTLYEAYSSVYKTGKPLRAFEYEITRKDGTKKFVEESVTLKRDAAGYAIGFMGIRRDCTERKQIGAELEKARDVALESTRLKSEFLANMSHEIRTPMNGVIGMTGLLLDTKLNAEQREFAETIQFSGEALLTIINDILDFSKIEAGKLQFETLDFNLAIAVEGAVELLAKRAADKNLELASLIYCDVTTQVRGDPGRLRQVLTNLLVNAIKFTDQGEVILRAEKESETDNDIVIRFTVTDTGIGIDEATQQRLFQAFTQADGSTTRKYGGTGLGLAISKQLVELMGGEIGVDSVPGKGSAFWFTARLAKQSGGAAEIHAESNGLSQAKLKPGRESRDAAAGLITQHALEEKTRNPYKLFLVAEDNVVNQKVAVLQLRSLGYRADAVANGREALEALERIPYDVVLMDCQMPEMDGYEATAEIRRREGQTKHTIIVAMTANALQGDREKCDAVGMDDYISKPVKSEELAKVLERVFASSTNGGSTNGKTAVNGAPKEVSPAVDMARLHEAMGDEWFEIVDIYLMQMAENLKKLTAAIDAGNAGQVALIAHNCAGTSANCGMVAVLQTLRELEAMGRKGCLDGAGALGRQAVSEFQRVKVFLQDNVAQLAV